MATKPTSVQKRPLTRVRDGVVLEPGEDLYYDKKEGYSARRTVSNAGAGRGFVNPKMYPQLSAEDHEAGAMQAESDRAKKKYSGGGKVRGCGAATKGLTKGKMR